MDFLTPSSPGSLPTLSLTTDSCWLPWGVTSISNLVTGIFSLLMPVTKFSWEIVVKTKRCVWSWLLWVQTNSKWQLALLSISNFCCTMWSKLWRRDDCFIHLCLFAVYNGKVNHATQESVGECSSPSPRPWARRWRTTNVCDAWPVWRQTYSYLPSRKASPPVGWYQIILLGDRGTCVC